MIVFHTANTTHTVKLIPRYNLAAYTFEVRDEFTGQVDTFNVVPIISAGYTVFDIDRTFEPFTHYQLTLRNADLICWRGKGFATSVTDVQDYEIKNDIDTL